MSDSEKFFERYFVLGSETRLSAGIVSESDARRWKRYIEQEGQALLRGPSEVRSLVNARREKPRVPDGPQPEYLLEHVDPANQEESLFPDVLTWQLYFRDVHGIYAESMEELLVALKAAGWPEEKVARYRDLDLQDAIVAGSPEDQEYTDKTVEFVAEDDVYTSSLECAFGLLRQLTVDFVESSEPDQIVARFRFFPQTKGVRWVYAVGLISMTALQELLNALDTGIRVRFWRKTDPPFWTPADLSRP